MYRSPQAKKSQQYAASTAQQAFLRQDPRGGQEKGRASAVSIRTRSPKLASALRVKNTRTLCDVAGEENLAIALGLPLQRVKDLKEGIDFSDEMAFHVETALGLRPGFLDSLNMELSETTKTMLKSPADAALNVHESEQEDSMNVQASHTIYRIDSKASKNLSLASAEVPPPQSEPETPIMEQTVEFSAPAAASAVAPSHAPAVAASTEAPATALTPPPVAAKRVRGEASPEELRLREVRKNNLALLTSAPGAKSKVSAMAGMSPVNLSHRLHGPKTFDIETSDLFCKALGLPQGWFEAPRTAEDIPASLLAAIGAPRVDSLVKEAPSKPVAPGAAPAPQQVSSSAPSPEKVAASAPSQKPEAPLKGARRNTMVATHAYSSAAPTVLEERAAQALDRPSVPSYEASVAMQEVGPVAEALTKTISMLSRKGMLSEKKALEVLNELMAA